MQEDSVTVRISEDGQVSVPAEFLRRVGLEGEQSAVLRVEGGELRLRPVELTIGEIQALVRERFADFGMTSDRFIAERREEARREEEEFG